MPVIINDQLDLAIESDADGLHLGQQDASLLNVRNQLGCNKIIGASCYNNLDLALQAEKEGADYVAFGAFFPSLTKPNTVSITVNLICEAKKKITIPIVVIGGIRFDNFRKVTQSVCAAIALCNVLLQSENIKVKAAHYAQLFAET